MVGNWPLIEVEHFSLLKQEGGRWVKVEVNW